MFLFSCRYFEGGVSSVYCWDLDDGFAAVILIKKSMYYFWRVEEGIGEGDDGVAVVLSVEVLRC